MPHSPFAQFIPPRENQFPSRESTAKRASEALNAPGSPPQGLDDILHTVNTIHIAFVCPEASGRGAQQPGAGPGAAPRIAGLRRRLAASRPRSVAVPRNGPSSLTIDGPARGNGSGAVPSGPTFDRPEPRPTHRRRPRGTAERLRGGDDLPSIAAPGRRAHPQQVVYCEGQRFGHENVHSQLVPPVWTVVVVLAAPRTASRIGVSRARRVSRDRFNFRRLFFKAGSFHD
jgi:hypothetical protein